MPATQLHCLISKQWLGATSEWYLYLLSGRQQKRAKLTVDRLTAFLISSPNLSVPRISNPSSTENGGRRVINRDAMAKSAFARSLLYSSHPPDTRKQRTSRMSELQKSGARLSVMRTGMQLLSEDAT